MHLFTISKPHINDPMRIKRLSDRVQYSLLPKNSDDTYCKLSLSQLRNHGHALTPSLGSHANNFMKNRLSCHVIFYYELGLVEQLLLDRLAHTTIVISEVLSNRVVMLTDGTYCYPLSLSKLVSSAIWLNLPLAHVIDKELKAIGHKFTLFRDLFIALRRRYADQEWLLENGKMHVTELGITRNFDYASLL